MMRSFGVRVLFALAACLAGFLAAPVAAERLVTSVSNHRVLITSNFTGTEIVVFGAIEDAPSPTPGAGTYDIAITVRGPRETYVTRRKDRVLGIWLNVESREFIDVPSYLAVMTSRPPKEMGEPDFLRRQGIGLVNQTFRQRIGADYGDVVPQDPFRAAFLRVRMSEGLFHEEPTGVTFITPRLFRATVPIPGVAPTGTYQVETLLISKQEVLARETTAIEVVKTGFEELLTRSARDHGLLYGLATALLAMGTGALASFIFRRD